MADVALPVIDNSMVQFVTLGNKTRAVAEYSGGERVGDALHNGRPLLKTNCVMFYGSNGYAVELTTTFDTEEFAAGTVFEPAGQVELNARSVDQYSLKVVGFAESLTLKGTFKVDPARAGQAPKDS